MRLPSVRSVAAVVLVLGAGLASAALVAGQPVALDRALFARGSCVSFAPTAGDFGRTVFLDAGHGGPDPGAIGVTRSGRTIEEARGTLPVVRATTALLRAAGYQVVDSRTRDSSVVRLRPGYVEGGIFTNQGKHQDLLARDACANLAKASLLIGVSFNAGAPQESGSLTLYDDARPFWRSSRRLAKLVQRDVLADLRADRWAVPSDGVHNDAGYGHLLTAADRAYGHLVLLGPAKAGYLTTPTKMPGALIEPLFITDPAEGSLANSRAGQLAIARGLTTAVEQYFAGVAKTARAVRQARRRTR